MRVSPTTLFGAICIFLIVGLTVSPCLKCFFFSEDLIQTYLASLEITGDWTLLWQRLSMPWIQCSNMGLFYRPFFDLTFVSDYLLYHNGGSKVLAIGSHLTNMSCHLTSSVVCFLIGRDLLRLSQVMTAKRATLTGLLAGLLFGLNPLQGEPVYWLVCRGDGLCTMLTLTGLWLWINNRRAPSLVACLLAILSKEQAVVLPFILVLQALIFGKYKKVIAAWPFFAMLAAYSALRLLILGGVGGYHGSIGVALNETLWERLRAPLAWSKIFYPLDETIFAGRPIWPGLFSLAYLAAAIGCWRGLSRFDKGNNSLLKTILFLSLSTFIVLLPTAQSFCITESLFGGRCLYLAQAFTSIILAILLTAIKPIILRRLFIPAYLLLLACTNWANGQAWVARSDNMRALQKHCNEWAAKASPERRLCLVNLPLDTHELSSMYDLEQLRCLLKQPINMVDNSDRLVQPTYLRMTGDTINASRLNALIDSGTVDFVASSVGLGRPFYPISGALLRQNLASINESIKTFAVAPAPELANDKTTLPYQLDLRSINRPQRADYIEVTVTPKLSSTDLPTKNLTGDQTVLASPVWHCPKGKTIFLLWYSDLTPIEPHINWSTAQFYDDGKPRRYIFPVADRISWKCSAWLNPVIIGNLPVSYKIDSVRLRKEDDVIPKLEAKIISLCSTDAINQSSATDGFYPINDRDRLRLKWQADQLPTATSVSLQISQTDFSYSLIDGGYRASTASKHSYKTIDHLPLDSNQTLERSDFPLIGKYEVRLCAKNKDDQMVGCYSDPICLIVTEQPFETKMQKRLFNLRSQPSR